MASAIDVAKYFLLIVASDEEDAGDVLTDLKLQKLVYYAQGFHLALFQGSPLFGEPIEAWKHGPVVQSMWGQYNRHGSNPIAADPEFDPNVALTNEQKELLVDVWNAYGQFSAWKLREMTHNEPPWKAAYAQGQYTVISQYSLREYFGTQIEG